MKPEELKKLQYQQLQIMDDIHRICVENKLRYYMIGGSALGAVRHLGFIPWDVDIDIAMPRSDYETFLKIAPMLLNERFQSYDYRTFSKYSSPHALVVMKNSYVRYSFSNDNELLGPEGIYVDILPLDIVPTDLILQNKHAKKLYIVKKIKEMKISRIYTSNNIFVKMIKYMLRVSLSPISWYSLNSRQQKIAQMYNDIENPILCCSTLSHYKYSKLVMPITYFGIPKLMKFEDREYFCPEHVCDYLTHLFGDYMKLPPLEIQQQHMNAVVSANWPDKI